MRAPLPVDDYVPTIRAALQRHRAVVLTAAPGAGKTTRVPPALAADGPTLLLQPRRTAARATARRIADEYGWSVGREVGWHVRLDQRYSPQTKLLVATEGVLTARLQADPLLSDFRTVVLDEFHERSIHADLGLALARQAWLARDDLRIVVMSATLDAAKVASYLGDCPVVDVPGRLFPVAVEYRPGEQVETAAAAEVGRGGAVLCFLPGASEIRRAVDAIVARVPRAVKVAPLYGALDGDEQDAVLRSTPEPRVIVATNIAETTVTVPDVRVVIDAGWQKVARYDAERGLDSLVTERVTADAAEQRAGRAGRVAAGRALRLWDARDRLRPYRDPDIVRVDLAGPVLDVLAWGADAEAFDWFEAPPADALRRSIELLKALGVMQHGRLTSLGKAVCRLPLHPRLGCFLLAAGGAWSAAVACAAIAERQLPPPARVATTCDLLAAVDRWREMDPHVRMVARNLADAAGQILGAAARDEIDEAEFRRSVLSAYPDRIARRRRAGGDQFLLASGSGARLGRESGVTEAEFIAAVEVSAAPTRPDGAPDAVIRRATAIDRDWISTTSRAVEHWFDRDAGRVRAVSAERVGAVTVRERDVTPEPDTAAAILARAYRERGLSEQDLALSRRLAFAGITASWDSLLEAACAGRTRLAEVEPLRELPREDLRRLEQLAPAEIRLPSGRTARLVYKEDGKVAAAVKLQELFGLGETPRVGRLRIPVTFQLLSPAGRPVQVTSDLQSFWKNGYPEVRRELRARYPRHPWPEDPWTAVPTHRTTPRQ